MRARVLMIDNYDSFTFNLVQAFAVLGAEVIVHRNDAITVAEARALTPSHVCISPGPGAPSSAGVSIDVLKAFAGQTPILGVCLGHQAIVEALGGTVGRAARCMHGKASLAHHDGEGILARMSRPFVAGRYHSLIAIPPLPDVLEVTARTDAGEIMAIQHRALPIYGVQFHPESILTPEGPRLLEDFLAVRS